jgi:hypothetical protein
MKRCEFYAILEPSQSETVCPYAQPWIEELAVSVRNPDSGHDPLEDRVSVFPVT